MITSDEIVNIEPVKVTPKDTTGAGDAFIGSFARFYAETGEVVSSLKKASLYAAHSITRPEHRRPTPASKSSRHSAANMTMPQPDQKNGQKMSEAFPRNNGTALKPEWFEDVSVNRSASERRAATITTRRSVKKEYQVARQIKAITCIDLTTLSGDDTPGRVRRLCAKARRPVRDDILEALGLADAGITTGAVCVYPTMVSHAVKALEGTTIPVASVATGFPSGLTPLPQRLAEIRYAVEQGAREIDIVITREFVLTQNWPALYDEIAAMREACGDAHMKAIGDG